MAELIKLRGENEHLFTGARNSAAAGWRAILEQMGLAGQINPLQAKKKWDNLKKKYKDCKYPASGEGVSGKTTAATWPWFVPMDEVLQMDEDVERRENEAQLEARPEKRKRDREDEVLELIKKDMRLQREIEERRAERMDRIICLLEKVVEKQNE
ncbi:unnamed protein product [Oreochromis niloticus]|nr:unnamed protein product [Mustela putorius furo]